MKRDRISQNVIRRLPMYLRKLDDLLYNKVERISSAELGRQMGLTPSQIRQDFSCFGEFGQQGFGYRVSELREQVARILGMNEQFSVAIIGVGNLGHALIENMKFGDLGFKIVAAFDTSPEKIGTEIAGVKVRDNSELENVLKEQHVDIVVLTVPKRYAKEMAAFAASCGVKGIWNFTNIELELNDPNVHVENIHFSDSLLTLSYYLNYAKHREIEKDEGAACKD